MCDSRIFTIPITALHTKISTYLLPVAHGTVQVYGSRPGARNDEIGYVPQHYDVNATSTQWLERVYPNLTRQERPYDCIETAEAAACMVCLDCEQQLRDFPGLAKVGERKTLFNFTVESTGALKPEEVVLLSPQKAALLLSPQEVSRGAAQELRKRRQP